MLRVDFYLLEQQTAERLYPFACRLLEKVFTQQIPVFVAHNNQEESDRFSSLLWTFNDISFIPHCLSTNEIAAETPIVLGLIQDLGSQKTLLNLCHQIPAQTHTLERIMEIIPDEPSWRTMARQKYLTYKNLQAEIHTHKL